MSASACFLRTHLRVRAGDRPDAGRRAKQGSSGRSDQGPKTSYPHPPRPRAMKTLPEKPEAWAPLRHSARKAHWGGADDARPPTTRPCRVWSARQFLAVHARDVRERTAVKKSACGGPGGGELPTLGVQTTGAPDLRPPGPWGRQSQQSRSRRQAEPRGRWGVGGGYSHGVEHPHQGGEAEADGEHGLHADLQGDPHPPSLHAELKPPPGTPPEFCFHATLLKVLRSRKPSAGRPPSPASPLLLAACWGPAPGQP